MATFLDTLADHTPMAYVVFCSVYSADVEHALMEDNDTQIAEVMITSDVESAAFSWLAKGPGHLPFPDFRNPMSCQRAAASHPDPSSVSLRNN